jgi:hypothetical protein
MRQELYNAIGLYKPSFFYIHLERDEDFSDYKSLDDIPAAAYLHEYIHFLQDITTNSGFINIYNVSQYIKYCTKSIEETPEQRFHIPIMPHYTFPIISPMDVVWYNIDHQSKYFGGILPSGIVLTSFEGIEQRTVQFPQLNGINKTSNQIQLKFKDQFGNKKDLLFGSLAISEGMAWEIETYIYGNVLGEASLYPYHSVRLVLKELFPELLDDPLVIVALCDASLLDFNPGRLFVELVNILKRTGRKSFEPNEVYETLKQFQFDVDGATNYISLLENMADRAIVSINEYFTTNLFKDTPIWIEHNIKQAVGLRKSNPLFVVNLMTNQKISNNKAFDEVYNSIGAPFVTNRLDQAFFSSTLNNKYDIFPEYLFAINQFYKLFYSKDISNSACQLKKWCKESCVLLGIADFTDTRCDEVPWTRALDSDPNLCTYGRMWKTWGLSNKSPI